LQKRKKRTGKKNLLPKIKVGTLVHDINMDHLILCVEDKEDKLIFIQGETKYIWPKFMPMRPKQFKIIRKQNEE